MVATAVFITVAPSANTEAEQVQWPSEQVCARLYGCAYNANRTECYCYIFYKASAAESVNGSMTVVNDLLTAAAGKVDLEKLAAGVGASGGAYKAAMEFAALPVDERLKEFEEGEEAIVAKVTAWTHRVYGELLDEVACSIPAFEGSLGHKVILSTPSPVRRPSFDRTWSSVGTGMAWFGGVAHFAHLDTADSHAGDVVNTRSHHVLKRNMMYAVVGGIPQAEGQGCLRLLQLETACDGVDLATGVGTAKNLRRVAYGVASDAYYLYVLKTSIEVGKSGFPRLVTVVSPALPLWPAAVMAAAYPPPADVEWSSIDAAKAAATAAKIHLRVVNAAVNVAAAAVATAQGISQAAAAAMAREVPLGTLVLACLLAADRELLGDAPVMLPTGGVSFCLPPDTVTLEDTETDWRESTVMLGNWSRVLGSGGFSDTFRVTWPGCPDGSCVAKFVRRPTTSAKLLREAAACMTLRHNTYVPALLGGHWREGGDAGDKVPVLTALVTAPVGVTLRNVLVDVEGTARLAVVVHAIDAVLRALVDAHAVGMSHNDVRSPNVIVHRLPPSRRPAAATGGAVGATTAAGEAAVAAAAAAAAAAGVATDEAAAAAGAAVAARRGVFAMLSDWGQATLTACTDDEKVKDVTDAIEMMDDLAWSGNMPGGRTAAVMYFQAATTASDALARLQPLRTRLAAELPDWARAGTE